jgi:hypothetical protein
VKYLFKKIVKTGYSDYSTPGSRKYLYWGRDVTTCAGVNQFSDWSFVRVEKNISVNQKAHSTPV